MYIPGSQVDFKSIDFFWFDIDYIFNWFSKKINILSMQRW